MRVYEAAAVAVGDVLGDHVLEDRGLTGTGLGNAQHITASQKMGNGGGLDGGGGGIAFASDGTQNGLDQAEFGEQNCQEMNLSLARRGAAVWAHLSGWFIGAPGARNQRVGDLGFQDAATLGAACAQSRKAWRDIGSQRVL